MSDVTAAVVGAVAVTCIPVFAWFSRRATKEGRLLLRVDRLGKAYALMPDSDEKVTGQGANSSANCRSGPTFWGSQQC